jgi:hypothetical protein
VNLKGFSNSSIGIRNVSGEVPGEYKLFQNYPNPFNPMTIIGYSLIANNKVRLIIYDINGKEIAELVNENQNTGTYEVSFDASLLSSGIYYYKLTAGSFADVKKMILIK